MNNGAYGFSNSPNDFSPLSIPGLGIWLDFADASTLFQDVDCTIPVTQDGQEIAGMLNKVGKIAYQGTSGKRPLYKKNIVNGQSVGRFDGSNDVLYMDTNQLGNAKDKSIIAVFKISILQYGGIITTKAAIYDNSPALNINTSSRTDKIVICFDGNSSPSVYIDAAHLISNGFFCLSGIRKGTKNSLYQNRALIGSFTSSTAASTVSTQTQIGTYRCEDSNFLCGDIAEILVYDQGLSDENLQWIFDYLSQKYGVL